MKILVIEDEPAMQQVVSEYLTRENFTVEQATTYRTAERKIADYQYDFILLDLMLPDGNGMDLLPQIKAQHPETAVIILSAKGSIEDKITGLNTGADDYLPKPYHLAELQARLQAIIRRKFQNGEHLLHFANLKMDTEGREVWADGNKINLNRKEFDILLYFATRPGKLIPKTMLAEAIWGDAIDQADSLDFIYSQIKNLKRKLAQAGAQAQITAVYGIGYKLEE